MRPEEEVQTDPRVTAALKALSDADRGVEAPLQVEATLRAAFRSRVESHRTGRMRLWRWVPALAAAAILAIVAAYYRGPRVEPARVASWVAQGVAPGAAPVIQRQITGTQPRISRAPAAQTTRRNAGRAPYPQPREIATDFFPLLDFVQPMDNVDGGELVRVSLPASAMREVGLPVGEDRLEDRVQADVLVSNGMATAIRFVKYMQ